MVKAWGKESHASVGAVLQRLRDERDWSQATLARRARVGVATIARIETDQINSRTGKVDIPKSTTLRKIAQALGDGNTERTLEAQHQLFAAAGYGPDDLLEHAPPADEIADLRGRLEALERQLALDPRDIQQQIMRMLDTSPPTKRQELIRLMQEALERYQREP